MVVALLSLVALLGTVLPADMDPETLLEYKLVLNEQLVTIASPAKEVDIAAANFCKQYEITEPECPALIAQGMLASAIEPPQTDNQQPGSFVRCDTCSPPDPIYYLGETHALHHIESCEMCGLNICSFVENGRSAAGHEITPAFLQSHEIGPTFQCCQLPGKAPCGPALPEGAYSFTVNLNDQALVFHFMHIEAAYVAAEQFCADNQVIQKGCADKIYMQMAKQNAAQPSGKCNRERCSVKLGTMETATPPVQGGLDAPAVSIHTGKDQAKKEAEEQAKKEAEEQARKEVEEQARKEVEEQARRKVEEQVKKEAEEQAKKEAEEQARKEAEEQARKEVEERVRKEAEEQARRKVEEQVKKQAEEQAKPKPANPRAAMLAKVKHRAAQLLQEKAAKKEEEEHARKVAEEQQQEAEKQARREEAEEQAQEEKEAHARKETQEQAMLAEVKRRAAQLLQEKAAKKEEQARKEVEEQARKEAEEQARKGTHEEQEKKEAAEEQARADSTQQARRQMAKEQARKEGADEQVKKEAAKKKKEAAKKAKREALKEQARREAVEDQAKKQAVEEQARKEM
jgi:hypothetical protein